MTAPYRFFDVRVVRAERLGPTMVRITFGGEDLAGFVSAGRDQRFKLFLPHPHQETPVVPTEEDWYARWRAMDPDVRAVMRSYTVCEQRRGDGRDEFDVEFALHGDGHGGPASRWADRARPGDRVTVLGPAVPDNGGVDFHLAPEADWVLLAADETALPAVAGILAWLPPGTRAHAWIEVPHAGDLRPLPTDAEAEVTWLVRGGEPHGLLLDAVRRATLPGGTPCAWIAGESGTVRALRRHLVNERGYDRSAVTFTGYWRLGACEEDILAEALARAEGDA